MALPRYYPLKLSLCIDLNQHSPRLLDYLTGDEAIITGI